MGVAIIDQGGKCCPMLTCDSCGEPIENLKLAVAQFAPTVDGATSNVRIYHRGKCDSRKGHWQPLSNYIPWLLRNHNLGIIKHTKKGTRLIVEVPEPMGI